MNEETNNILNSKLITFLQNIKYKLELAILLLDFTIINIRLLTRPNDEHLQYDLNNIKTKLFYRLPQ